MSKRFRVLFADRNVHVREFLRREFAREDCETLSAGSADDVRWHLDNPPPLDLLVIDPDLPLVEGLPLLARIARDHPSLPVIIHTDCTEIYTDPATRTAVTFLEKTGNLDPLKRAIVEVRQQLALRADQAP